jgi:3-oxoacyl-[acyl-carrier protein] reductase
MGQQEERWLEGMVALVTGAGRGEDGGGGAGISRYLARQGAKVAVNDLTEEFTEATVDQICSRGGEAWGIVGDVSDPADANRMVDAVVRHFGRIDILVNNAAIGGLIPAVERLPDEVWHRQVAVDLSGPFYMSRAALRYMIPQGFGRIVNIASLAAVRTGFVSGSTYTTAKTGLLGLTRQMAFEVAQFGITVNALMPTGIRNPRILRMRPEWLQAEGSLGPLDPEEEIGKLVAFLSRRDVTFISGAAIPLDRGLGSALGNFEAYKQRSGTDAG